MAASSSSIRARAKLTPAGYAQARDAALVRIAAIRRVIGENRGADGPGLTAADAERLHREGKRIAFISMENGWPLGEDLTLLATFHRLGLRMAGPVHSRTNQLADSATGEARWNGLSPLGRQWVAEMNRLGIVIDGSHSSDATFDQMLALSRVPIVLSHSGPKAIFEPQAQPRRRADAAAGPGRRGDVHELDLPRPARRLARARRDRRAARALGRAERGRAAAIARRHRGAEPQRPYTTADFDLYMRSLLHAISVMGVDHVGLGADWDGGGGVIGMEDISLLPRITARLRREGFSEPTSPRSWAAICCACCGRCRRAPRGV